MKRTPLLDSIRSPQDLKRIDVDRLPELAEEIRSFLVEKVSCTGGHLASNLGVVELTIALLRVFDLPEDKVIYDVGHQAYVHKMLTGRSLNLIRSGKRAVSAVFRSVLKAFTMPLVPAMQAHPFPQRSEFSVQKSCLAETAM